jgi:hypothetical protein
MSIIMRWGLREQYGTVVAGEKAGLWPICCETGNFGAKPGLVRGIFQNVLFLATFSGIMHDLIGSSGAALDRAARCPP